MDRNEQIYLGAGVGAAVLLWLYFKRKSGAPVTAESDAASNGGTAAGNVSVNIPGIDLSMFKSGEYGGMSGAGNSNLSGLIDGFLGALKARPNITPVSPMVVSGSGNADQFPLFGYAAGGDTVQQITNNITNNYAAAKTYSPVAPAPTLSISTTVTKIPVEEAMKMAKAKASNAAQAAQTAYFGSYHSPSSTNPYYAVYNSTYESAMRSYGY
jgi:hypothetical protein